MKVTMVRNSGNAPNWPNTNSLNAPSIKSLSAGSRRENTSASMETSNSAGACGGPPQQRLAANDDLFGGAGDPGGSR